MFLAKQINKIFLFSNNKIMRLFWKKIQKNLYLMISGIAIGIVNGFFGGGGGMICIPILEKILKIDNKKSHATALAIMLPIGISSAIIYLIKIPMDWPMFGFVTTGFVAGGLLGALLLRKLSGKVVRIIFIVVVLTAGIKMLV